MIAYNITFMVQEIHYPHPSMLTHKISRSQCLFLVLNQNISDHNVYSCCSIRILHSCERRKHTGQHTAQFTQNFTPLPPPTYLHLHTTTEVS